MPDGVGWDGFWESWAEPLGSFVEATGLTCAIYDRSRHRRLGPVHGSRLASKLAEGRLWHADGAGTALEQQLADVTLATGEPAAGRFFELVLGARPVRFDDNVIAVLTVGWAADRFASSLEATRLARAVGVDPQQLWRLIRAQPPCSPTRFAVMMKLADTLLVAHAAHLRSIERAEQLSRTRDRFIASAAHELRTPLAAIAMRVELLLGGSTPPEVRAALEKIAASVAVESRLIEDLIEAGRTLTGQLRVALERCAVLEIAREVVDTCGPVAAKKHVQLSLHPTATSDETIVLGDAMRLRQAIINLVTNALKFTPAGGQVAVRLEAGDRDVAIDVTDTGHGLEPEQLRRVFEPFVKTDRNNEAGLGLGLFITKQIVELHGGAISASSAGAGLGATFVIQLPRAGAPTLPA